MSYYRVQAADFDTAALLDPELQVSESYSSDDVRTGISVCDSLEELATYLAGSGVPFDATSVVVELDGPDSDDEDEDAHLGARLIMPTSIISVTPITDTLLDLIDAAFDAMEA
ncbi:hypothetical protein ABH922_002812 [Rhodococcus sp. 27YEA15]|uniref:hypothetical protein n=1 Tax=Rhodococcus sp. 27YEA15 TaxID=3156259 RepID=UPI003C7E641C